MEPGRCYALSTARRDKQKRRRHVAKDDDTQSGDAKRDDHRVRIDDAPERPVVVLGRCHQSVHHLVWGNREQNEPDRASKTGQNDGAKTGGLQSVVQPHDVTVRLSGRSGYMSSSRR
jgi:hypothetical protein